MSPQDQQFPPRHQEHQPGSEAEMRAAPRSDRYRACGKLEGKVAIITGGDSGIGRAVAIAFAKEGADIAIVYLEEHEDAKDTRRQVERMGQRCVTLAGDVADESFCQQTVQKTVDTLGHLDILVNNAGEQYPQENLTDISVEQLDRMFRTNIFSFFYMAKAALPHLKEGSASVNAYVGNAT